MERRDDAPGTVYVISRDTIRARGYTSLKDVLQSLPGFFVLHRDLGFVAAARGLIANDNEKISLLINGKEMNNVYEPNYLNGPINLENVERVEVIVGPSSLFMPANTLAATINIITRKVEGVEFVLAGGTERAYSVTTLAGHEWAPGKRISASLSIEERRGFDAWSQTHSPQPMASLEGQTLTGESDPSHFLVLTGELNDWTLQVTSFRTVFPELQLEGYGNKDAIYTEEMHAAAITHEHTFSDHLTTILSLSGGVKESTRMLDSGTPAAGIELANAQHDWEAEAGIIYTGFDRHRVQLGIQGAYEENFDTYYTISDPTPRRTMLVDQDTQSIGVYLSDTMQATDKLILVGGVRSDHNTITDQHHATGGRVAAIYRLTSCWTTKLMYNSAARMPSPLAALNKEWGIEGSGPTWATQWPLANKPERLTTLEWQTITYLGQVRLALTLYHQELKHYISWAGPHTNIGDFSGDGVEASAEYHPTDRLLLWANGNYMDNVFDPRQNSGKEELFHTRFDPSWNLVGSPSTTVNAGTDYDITESITVTTSVRYFTRQVAQLDPNGDTRDPATFGYINDQAYLDAGVLCRNVMNKNVDLRISGKNILDNRDMIAGAWLGGLYRPRGASVEMALYFRF